jgi:hypothetical protein
MIYSSRFATRTARTQGTGQRGKKRACFQTGPSLGQVAPSEPSWVEVGVKWVEVGPKLTPSRANVPYTFWRHAVSKMPPLLLDESWTELEPKLAPIGHVGLKLGPRRSRWTRRRSKVMHMEAQVTSKVAQLGTLWRQLHTKLGPTGTQHGEHCFKQSVVDTQKILANTSENGRFE